MKPREREIDHLVEQHYRYDPNTGKLYHKVKNSIRVNTGDEVGWINHNNYRYATLKYVKLAVHRIIWRIYYGSWPNYQLDHINGNKLDNRICNLREVTPRENCQNKKIHRSGKIVGSKKAKNKFISTLKVNNKQFHLGYFESEIEAHQHYLKACEVIKTRKFKTAKQLRTYLNK